MNRLTNRKAAEALEHNVEGLMAKGFEPPMEHQRYIKLANYENGEERKERTSVNYDPDEWYE
jgi:hypothetical protein